MSLPTLLARLAATRPVVGGRLAARLSRPVRPFAVVMGWIGSSIVFLLVATALGGPTEGDSAEVVYGTWAIAHGHLACVYPVVSHHVPTAVLAVPFALAAPLYPIFAGLLAFALRIGHAVPYPSTAALGPGCVHGFSAAYHWVASSGAILPTVRLGYATWVVLLAGLAYLVRSTPLRDTGWEVLSGFMVAVSPPVVMSLTYFFHPQDLLAMGLVLAATGAFVRERFALCGVLAGLALSAQQFAVLAVVVLVVLAGRRSAIRLIAGIAAAVVVIDTPFVVVSGWRAVRTAALGSSRVGLISGAHGGTVLFATGLTGPADFVLARVAPIAGAALLAWWARRAVRSDLSNGVLVVLVTAGLWLRLAFEVNLFGYYFMATLVGLAVVETLRREVGRDVVAFVGLLMVAFNPEHIAFISNLTSYGLSLYYDLPIIVLGLGVVTLLYDTVRRRFSPTLVLWLAIVTLAGQTHLFGRYTPFWAFPEWAWQIVLVGYLMVVVARRLRWAISESAPAEELAVA